MVMPFLENAYISNSFAAERVAHADVQTPPNLGLKSGVINLQHAKQDRILGLETQSALWSVCTQQSSGREAGAATIL